MKLFSSSSHRHGRGSVGEEKEGSIKVNKKKNEEHENEK
jgi:hypothetical protein